MDEMEIMREFKKWYCKWVEDNGERPNLKDIEDWLYDAVKCQIVRVLKSFKTEFIPEYKTNSCGVAINYIKVSDLNDMIAKYSPKPIYCENLIQAIRPSSPDGFKVGQIEDRGKDGLWMLLMRKISTDYYWNWKQIKCCPFCEDGKNCIGGNK